MKENMIDFQHQNYHHNNIYQDSSCDFFALIVEYNKRETLRQDKI
jgi:hypothetical protein